MVLLVQKFGGTSVGSLQNIQHVADKVALARQQGHDVAVVLSAMSGETDRLIKMAKEMQEDPDPREYSMLVSTGEQVTIGLLALALQARGCKARAYTGGQAGIITDNDYKKARIMTVQTDRIRADLNAGYVPVIAGFQGMTEQGDITTLGRGGSDTTAVAIAAALKADECQIYTDVDGVYTTDPRIVPEARRLNQVTFEEMLELASLGAKVLQIRSVEFAGKYNVPLRVLSTFNEGPGTLITMDRNAMEDAVISGIAFNRTEAKITVLGVPDMPGVAYQVLGPISDANIEVDMIVQNVAADELTDFTFTVNREDFQRAMAILNNSCKQMGARHVMGDCKIAKLSLVGVGMRSHAGIASKMFATMGREGINIQMIATSEIKISVIIDEKYLELGVRALHEVFNLHKAPLEEFDPLSSNCLAP